MNIRQTMRADLETVMDLYAQAREYMHTHGNPNQWVNGYPQRDLIAREIEQGHSFVCLDGAEIVAVFSLIRGEEASYRKIYDGGWMNDAPYGTVHRICVGRRGSGVGAFCLRWCLEQCGNIRIDTHKDNLPMQSLIKKCGFTYCGWITIADGSERLAFQKTI